MAQYEVKTPREKYGIKADNKDDARKIVLERENISIEKIESEVKPFEIIDIRQKLPYARSNGTMDKSKIDTVVIHHDGQFRQDAYDSLARYQSQARYHISKGYNHISYHFIIDNVGDIFRCLDDTEVAWHCGNYFINKRSIAVKFDGNMDNQQLTDAQIKSYKKLMVYLTTLRPDLPKVLRGSVKAHREIKSTSCPGANTMPFIHEF